MPASVIAIALASVAIAACCLTRVAGTDLNDGGDHVPTDAGPDAGRDAGPDAGVDAGLCARSDPWSRPRLVCNAARDAGACQPGSATDFDTYATYSPKLWMGGIASADLNGDGLLDLVSARFGAFDDAGAGMDVFFGQSDGGLTIPKHYAGSEGFTLAIGDIDNDGIPDVVVTNGGELDLFANDGDGGLSPLERLGISQYFVVDQVAIVDLNQDGLADILFSGEASFAAAGSLNVFWGQPCGGFSGPAVLAGIGGNGDYRFALGDLNRDCLPDLIANTTDFSQLVVLLNRGDGGFQTSQYPTPALSGVVLLPNASGTSDLIVCATGYPPGNQFVDNGLQLFLNNGDGTFETGANYRVGGEGALVGDFNGDCIPDILTTFETDCVGGGRQATVLFGDGDGGFGNDTQLPAAGIVRDGCALLGPVASPRALAVGDSCGHGLTVFGDASGK